MRSLPTSCAPCSWKGGWQTLNSAGFVARHSGMGLCLMITPRSSSLAEMLVAPAALLIGGCTALLLDLEGARGTAAALALAQQVMAVIRPLPPPRIPPPLVAPCGGRATHNSGREGTASSGPATVGRQHI